jgi:hypothetical protein
MGISGAQAVQYLYFFELAPTGFDSGRGHD